MSTDDRPDGEWIQTYTGRQFWPLNPRVEDVDILDIAHGLSQTCRYNGQCDRLVSVAQHSIQVSKHVPRPLKLRGLLHDASEAYIPDFPRPIKAAFKELASIEARLLHVIGVAFGIPDLEVKYPIVKVADDRVCMTEARDNMKPPPTPWTLTAEPYHKRIFTRPSGLVEDMFLYLFEELYHA